MKIELDTSPFVPESWGLVRGLSMGLWFSIESLELRGYISQLQFGDGKLTGYELFKEVEKFFPANANLLDFFLENQTEIPCWIKEICPVFFMGTIYKDASGRECVRCLCYSNLHGVEKFYWRWRWLSDYWRVNNPVLMLQSQALSFLG